MQVPQELKDKLHETIVIILDAYSKDESNSKGSNPDTEDPDAENPAKDETIDIRLVEAVIEVLAEVAEPKVKVFGQMPVKYVGKREEYSDGLFETGVWKKNQTKLVSMAIAGKMLEHADVYVPGDEEKGAEIVIRQEKKDDDDPNSEKLMDAKQAVQNMTRKDAVVNFVATNYNGMKIPEEFSKLSDMKSFAIRQIDLYSLP